MNDDRTPHLSSATGIAGAARQESGPDLAALFTELAERWREETWHLSSPSQIAMHRDYQRIIGLGEKVLPFILKDLRDRGGEWYWALKYITGASPVAPDAAGDSRRVRAAWIQWGVDHGYLR